MAPQRTEKWKTGKTEDKTRRKRGTYSEDPDADPVKTISRRMNLKEGEEAVWRILREVY